MIVHFFFLLSIRTSISSFIGDQSAVNQVIHTSSFSPEKKGWFSSELMRPSNLCSSSKESTSPNDEDVVDTSLSLACGPSLTLSLGQPGSSQKIGKSSTFWHENDENQAQANNPKSWSKKRKFSQPKESNNININHLDYQSRTFIPHSYVHQSLNRNDARPSKQTREVPLVLDLTSEGDEVKIEVAPLSSLKPNTMGLTTEVMRKKGSNFPTGKTRELETTIEPLGFARFFIVRGHFFVPNIELRNKGQKNACIYLASEVMGMDILEKLGLRLDRRHYISVGDYKKSIAEHSIKSTITNIGLANTMFEPPLYQEDQLFKAQHEAVLNLQEFWNKLGETDGLSRIKDFNFDSQEEKNAFGANVECKEQGTRKSNQISNTLFLLWMRQNFPDIHEHLARKYPRPQWQPWFVEFMNDKLLSLEWTVRIENSLESRNKLLKQELFDKLRIEQFFTYTEIKKLKLSWEPKSKAKLL